MVVIFLICFVIELIRDDSFVTTFFVNQTQSNATPNFKDSVLFHIATTQGVIPSHPFDSTSIGLSSNLMSMSNLTGQSYANANEKSI